MYEEKVNCVSENLNYQAEKLKAHLGQPRPPKPPEKETQIQRALDELGDAINNLNLVLPEIYNRLNPVLIPEAPAVKEENKKSAEDYTIVPLARSIITYTNSIRSFTEKAYNTLDRLEL